MGITFSDDALQLIVDAGGGHRFLTRQLCSYAIQDKPRPLTVTFEQAIQGIEKYLSFPENYLASLWQMDTGGPPTQEAQILKSLASQQKYSHEEILALCDQADNLREWELAIAHLADQSIIRKRYNKWEMTIPIYRHWIQRNILNMPYTEFYL